MKKLTLLIVGLCSMVLVHAQQLPLFSQNSHYRHIINPATDHIDNMAFGMEMDQFFAVSFRRQWAGIKDSPMTGLLRYDRKFADMNMLAGLSLIADETGPTSFNGAYLRYAYQMKMGDGNLSIGLGVGFVQHRFIGHESYLRDANDYIGLESRTKQYLDFSLGAYYEMEVGYGNIFYLGASIPQVTDIQISNDDGGDYVLYRNRHYQANMGFLKFMGGLSGDVDLSYLEPYLQINLAENAPIKTTAGLRFQLEGLIWVGAAFSGSKSGGQFNGDDLRFEAGVILGTNSDNESLFRIGFASSKSLTPYSIQLGSTQEINLSYSF